MGKLLVHLIFGCAVLAFAVGVAHFFGVDMPDDRLGVKWAVYLGIILAGAQGLHMARNLPRKYGNGMKRLIGYTTTLAVTLYLASFAVALLAGLVASATGSNVGLALGFSASLLMWWPLVRDLVPVASSVVIHGRWPTRNV